MALDTRIKALRRAGFAATTIGAILGIDRTEVINQVLDPSRPDPTTGGGTTAPLTGSLTPVAHFEAPAFNAAAEDTGYGLETDYTLLGAAELELADPTLLIFGAGGTIEYAGEYDTGASSAGVALSVFVTDSDLTTNKQTSVREGALSVGSPVLTYAIEAVPAGVYAVRFTARSDFSDPFGGDKALAGVRNATAYVYALPL